MRFMMLVKSQRPGVPPKEFMDEMVKLAEQASKEGSMVASGGLAPIAASTRISLSQGKIIAIDGPFAETREVVGGYAVMDFKSKQEAVEGVLRFMELHQKHWPGWEGETEIRQILSPEEFGPKP
jgi:hypothetical protein